MSTRIADITTSRNYLKHLNTAKSAYAKTNEQLASGHRFERLSDDVSAGSRVMYARMDLYTVEKQLDNVETIYDELSTAEDSMDSIEDLLVRAQELALTAMSEDKGEAGRQAIAAEVASLKKEFLQYANIKQGDRFIFGGANASLLQPFEAAADGTLTYNGIPVDSIMHDADGYYYTDAAGDRQPIPMDEDIFVDVGLGLTMTGSTVDANTAMGVSYSGLDIMGFGVDADGNSLNIYNILNDIENNITNFDVDLLGETHTRLVDATDDFVTNLTDIGAKTNMLENLVTRYEKEIDSYRLRIDNLMGVDEAELATAITMNDFVLKAVTQMGSRILPTSLMDFLG